MRRLARKAAALLVVGSMMVVVACTPAGPELLAAASERGSIPGASGPGAGDRDALLTEARELLSRSAVRVGYESTDRALVRQALEVLEPAACAAPRDVALRYWTGYALFCDQRGEQARAHLEAALAVDPEHFDALQVLGTIAMNAGAGEEARTWLERAVALRPEDANAHYLFGKCLEEVGEARGAEVAYRAALTLHPGFIEPYNRLGCLLMRAGREREAQRMFAAFGWWKAHKVALRDRPLEDRTNDGMSGPRGAPSLALLKRRLAALAEVEPDTGAESSSTLALARARVAAASGELGEARHLLREARRRSRADADLLCELGHEWLSLAEPERAAGLHAAALRADSGHVETLVALARALESRGRRGAARRRWQDVLREAPGCVEARAALDALANK